MSLSDQRAQLLIDAKEEGVSPIRLRKYCLETYGKRPHLLSQSQVEDARRWLNGWIAAQYDMDLQHVGID